MKGRPNYDFVCDTCKSPIVVDAILTDEQWALIAEGDYCLCPVCIDERFAAKGMKVEAKFHYMGKGLWSGEGTGKCFGPRP
jgi:hypothetical protein